MRYIKKLFLAGVLALAVMLTGCGDPGTPPELIIDGVSIVVGETTMSSMEEQGFTTDWFGIMPEDSYTTISLGKDHDSRGMYTIVNDSDRSCALSAGVIYGVKLQDLDEKELDFDVTVNGVSLVGMTKEELAAAYPEMEYDEYEENADSDYYSMRDGDYSVFVWFTDGVMNSIHVDCHY